MNLISAGEYVNARTSYNALSSPAKPLVNNYNILLEAEAPADAQIVIILIYQQNFSLARSSYDALSYAAKPLVTNYNVLLEVEAQIQMFNDIFAAQNVMNFIAAGYWSLARSSYDALTPSQKALVSNYNILSNSGY